MKALQPRQARELEGSAALLSVGVESRGWGWGGGLGRLKGVSLLQPEPEGVPKADGRD